MPPVTGRRVPSLLALWGSRDVAGLDGEVVICAAGVARKIEVGKVVVAIVRSIQLLQWSKVEGWRTNLVERAGLLSVIKRTSLVEFLQVVVRGMYSRRVATNWMSTRI